MTIERENAHRRSEACAYARAAARRRRQDETPAARSLGQEFNIILIMRSIAGAKTPHFQRPPLPFSAQKLTFDPPLRQREPVQMLMTPSRTPGKIFHIFTQRSVNT